VLRLRSLLVAGPLFAVIACANSSVGVDASPDPADAAGEIDAGPTPDAAPSIDAAPPADAACELGTVDNCSDCGDVCPGTGATNGDVACEAMTCQFRCAGETYDVNGEIGDGCEESDTPTGNHVTGGAIDLGSMPCDDGDSNPNISGVMVSDERDHVPVIPGFSSSSGSAPDVYKFRADGGLCINEVAVNLAVAGSSAPNGCYRLNVVTTSGTYTCTTGSSGTCGINEGQGSYVDNTDIIIQVQKVCSATQLTERVTYTVTGHF
jgi:hypothetical protein